MTVPAAGRSRPPAGFPRTPTNCRTSRPSSGRLLGSGISPLQARSISRRFLLGPTLYLVGTLLGALVPVLGVVVFGALILFYWRPPASSGADPVDLDSVPVSDSVDADPGGGRPAARSG